MGALRGQRHIPSKHLPKYPPPPGTFLPQGCELVARRPRPNFRAKNKLRVKEPSQCFKAPHVLACKQAHLCKFGENFWWRTRRMAWPTLLAHWWLRRQKFSPNVRVIIFTLPPAAGLLLARRLCKSGALKLLSARSF